MLKPFFSRNPELKSARELALMREAGKVVVEALTLCRSMCRPGVKTIDIDRAVEALYAQRGAIPLFKNYKGGSRVPFPACTCISLNEEVVHGIPGPRVIRDGDLVKIDTACKLNGWCADRAISVVVGTVRPEWLRLLKVGEETLRIAITELPKAKRWSEVARKMQSHVEKAGFSVVTQYVGHGIGRIMHENPQVPNFVSADARKNDFKLEPGLVLAIEPMVNMGREDVETRRDHWTVVTSDGMPSVHIEHTVALTEKGSYIITADDESQTFVPQTPAAAEAPPPEAARPG